MAAMRLVAAAQAEHIELSVIDIFQYPKLSELAANCSSGTKESTHEDVVEPFGLIRLPLSRAEVLHELAQQCSIASDQIQDAYPTSPLQEAFVMLSIKQPGAYVAQHILRLQDSVDLPKFKAAWEKAVQEIDLLRTRIAQLQSGLFMQAVLVEDPIEWQEATSLKEVEAMAIRVPSHLGGKLAAYAIVHTASNERYFVWTLHHSLYDGWSIPLMLQRVQQIYHTGLSQQRAIPYTRFIRYLVDGNPETASKYWKEHLAGTAAYQFPQQCHSVSPESTKGEEMHHAVRFDPPRYADITLSTVIRAAWALVLASYTNSDDVIFGETLTGRDITVPGVTDMCGPTLTTVPTRVRIDEGATVLDLLKDISRNAMNRIPHQHLGLSEIKRIDQDTAAACDFQNLLAIQVATENTSESMWTFHNSGIQNNYFTYPLVIECKAAKESVQISAYYNANTISAWEVQRILYQLDSVLSQLGSVGNVRDIQVLSDQDKELVRNWNSREPVTIDDTVPSLFFKQAAARPYATAISSFDGDFTYAELRDLASCLSQELIKYGAGPEQLIPLCVDKSRWAVVAIMAILIAGAGYVPLSPEHPESRHRQIVQDCKASIVLASPAYEARFTQWVGNVFSVCEQTIRQLPAQRTPVSMRAKSNNVCYVLYTSGSTGVPKGVVIEHLAIVSSSAAICKALHIHPSSRVFQFGSFVFDASVMEIITTLTCGATICMPSEQERTSDIASAINRLKATWTCLTPSVANTIESPSEVPSLKTFASGAEVLTHETINKWSPGLQLLNAYGPTEGSIVAVANQNVSTQRDPSNIGHVLQSGRAWLTNPTNPARLAPVGAVAELCIEGPLLARGYLNNRAKTAESFVENPPFLKDFSRTALRVYRTGDLVQYTPDGSLRYLGRKDNQVKLAGQRMELGEIEHHLQACKNVRQAVVQMPTSGPAKRKLTAVLSFHATSTGSVNAQRPWHQPLAYPGIFSEIDAVKDALSDLIPAYMVPAVWVAVSNIPTLASAKLDRSQVRSWIEGMDDDTYHRILELEVIDESINGTLMTNKMQNIWAKVLNIPISNVKPSKSWFCKLPTFQHMIKLDVNVLQRSGAIPLWRCNFWPGVARRVLISL